MNRTRLITIAAVILLVSAAVATPAIAQTKAPMTPGMGRAGRGLGPQFTIEQQEQIQKIHERYNDERAELSNRLKVIELEMKDIIASDSPDFKAIEKKMEEVAAVRLDLAKLRLKIHQDIRPLLDDDQKVLFDRNFGRHLGRGAFDCMGAGPMGARGGRDGWDRMGRHARGGRSVCGGMGTGMGMGMGTGPRAEAGTCPWLSGVDEEATEEGLE